MKIGKYLSTATAPKVERVRDGKCSAYGCTLPGSLCRSIGGPAAGQDDNREWLCRFHFPVSDRKEWPEITEKINRGDLGIEAKPVPDAKTEVLKSVTVRGPLRWAHEVMALYNAGMYPSYKGYKMACEALKVDPSQVETSW
jgi:hypothetical protein